MGKHHKLTQSGEVYECNICGPTTTWTRRGVLKCKGLPTYKNRRKATNVARNFNGRFSYRKFKIGKTHCWVCGFKAVDPCQLDVDHINGNSKDHREENLWILCANCHRLKTKLNKDSGPSRDTNEIMMYIPGSGVLAVEFFNGPEFRARNMHSPDAVISYEKTVVKRDGEIIYQKEDSL